jgi:hypothetical protein
MSGQLETTDGTPAAPNSMVERVASILAPAAFDPCSDLSMMNARSAERTRTRAIALARRVILTMREPTKAMIEAGDKCNAFAQVDCDPRPETIGWRAMVDAALGEH